jgi:4-carboxymuconolactone decarboxylase
MRTVFFGSVFLGSLALAFGVGFAAAQNAAPPPDPRTVKLEGGRFAPLTYDTMTPEQKKVLETLLNGRRRSAAGPFNILLRSPEMANAAQLLGLEVRFNSSIPRKESELAMLVTVRHWLVHFEWYAHSRSSRAAGISQATIDAVKAGTRPPSMPAEEGVIYDFTTELLTTKRVSDRTFTAVKEKWGERGVVDLIGLVAYYQMASMLLNVDQYPLPAGVKPELTPFP